jgi:hypothetical protein
VRRSLVAVAGLLACTALSSSLTSCATFDRNDVAAKVGHSELTAKEAQQLVKGDDPAQVGPHLRAELTAWIKLASVAESKGTSLTQLQQQARDAYAQGVSGSPAVCVGAILVPAMSDTKAVLDALQGGMSFADAAGIYSQNSVLASNGGLLVDADGTECVASATVPGNLADALKEGKEGQPFAHDFGNFAAVLVLRSYDELSFDSRADVATSGLTELEMAKSLKDAGVWVDPRYGRWSTLSESVEPLQS